MHGAATHSCIDERSEVALSHHDLPTRANHCSCSSAAADTTTLHSDVVSCANWIHIIADQGSTNNTEIHSDVASGPNWIQKNSQQCKLNTWHGFADNTRLHFDVIMKHAIHPDLVNNAIRYLLLRLKYNTYKCRSMSKFIALYWNSNNQ